MTYFAICVVGTTQSKALFIGGGGVLLTACGQKTLFFGCSAMNIVKIEKKLRALNGLL